MFVGSDLDFSSFDFGLSELESLGDASVDVDGKGESDSDVDFNRANILKNITSDITELGDLGKLESVKDSEKKDAVSEENLGGVDTTEEHVAGDGDDKKEAEELSTLEGQSEKLLDELNNVLIANICESPLQFVASQYLSRKYSKQEIDGLVSDFKISKSDALKGLFTRMSSEKNNDFSDSMEQIIADHTSSLIGIVLSWDSLSDDFLQTHSLALTPELAIFLKEVMALTTEELSGDLVLSELLNDIQRSAEGSRIFSDLKPELEVGVGAEVESEAGAIAGKVKALACNAYFGEYTIKDLEDPDPSTSKNQEKCRGGILGLEYLFNTLLTLHATKKKGCEEVNLLKYSDLAFRQVYLDNTFQAVLDSTKNNAGRTNSLKLVECFLKTLMASGTSLAGFCENYNTFSSDLDDIEVLKADSVYKLSNVANIRNFLDNKDSALDLKKLQEAQVALDNDPDAVLDYLKSKDSISKLLEYVDTNVASVKTWFTDAGIDNSNSMATDLAVENALDTLELEAKDFCTDRDSISKYRLFVSMVDFVLSIADKSEALLEVIGEVDKLSPSTVEMSPEDRERVSGKMSSSVFLSQFISNFLSSVKSADLNLSKIQKMYDEEKEPKKDGADNEFSFSGKFTDEKVEDRTDNIQSPFLDMGDIGDIGDMDGAEEMQFDLGNDADAEAVANNESAESGVSEQEILDYFAKLSVDASNETSNTDVSMEDGNGEWDGKKNFNELAEEGSDSKIGTFDNAIDRDNSKMQFATSNDNQPESLRPRTAYARSSDTKQEGARVEENQKQSLPPQER